MAEMQTITALLDANTLYPAPVRDLLLHLADLGLFASKWTELIHDEWIRNLLSNRPELKLKNLHATKQAMNLAFPDANVKGFHSLIAKLALPDADDKHVLAAAIHGKANCIVTFNIKHFPQKHLTPFSIQGIHPDDFIVQLIHQNKETVLEAFNNQVANLKSPPMTKEEVLNSLKKCGLKKSVSMFPAT